jgi:hypothetical protein
VAHPLILLVAVPLTLACARRRPRAADAPLLLLMLLLLLRCLLDPWDTVYYWVPFLYALLAWETTTSGSPPLLALAASFVVWIVFEWIPDRAGADAQALAFLCVALPALLAVALALYAPRFLARLRPVFAGRAATSGA